MQPNLDDTNGSQVRASSAPAPNNTTGGSELELSSAHETDQLVTARGSLFLVTERHGDIAPKGARELGLFWQDTRYLSHLALRIVDRDLVYLSSDTSHDAYNQVDLMVSGFGDTEFLDDPQNFLHVRRRQLLDGALVEQLTLTNFLGSAVSLLVELAFDADFADIFEVRGAKRPKRGTLAAPIIDAENGSVTLSYTGLDFVQYSTDIELSPKPMRLSASHACFRVDLAPGESQIVEMNVVPRRSQQRHTVLAFGQRVDSVVAEARAFRDDGTRIRCDNSTIQSLIEQSATDLYSLRVAVGANRIVAAGIPWFCCPFGRDSLLASYEALLLNPNLAVETLHVLAEFQGRAYDDVTEEEPGKIFHELRFGEMVNTGELPHSPYYGSIDATPLFVIVADATYRMTADLEALRGLRGAIVAALGWIDTQSQNATQLVSYQRRSARGLDNQGWKDSRAGVSFPDGRRAEAPIALCEVQGYCVDAYARGSRILHVLGETDLAHLYDKRAQAMRELVNDRFWLEAAGRYAFAIDGHGRPLPTVVSNLGHLLWSRVPSAARAAQTTELLLKPESFSGFGVRTLATDQAVYNPLSYHNGTVWPHDNAIIAKGMANYGHTGYAASIFEALVEASRYFRDYRLPELFCGMPRSSGNLVRYPVACSPQAWAAAAPFLLLQSVLGLHVDAPGGRLAIRNASLPASINSVELEGLRIGRSRVSLRLRRDGRRVHVDRLDFSGPSLRTEIEIDS